MLQKMSKRKNSILLINNTSLKKANVHDDFIMEYADTSNNQVLKYHTPISKETERLLLRTSQEASSFSA